MSQSPEKIGVPPTRTQRHILRWIAYQLLHGRMLSADSIARDLKIKNHLLVKLALMGLRERGLVSYRGPGYEWVSLVGAELQLRYHDTDSGRRLQEALEADGHDVERLAEEETWNHSSKSKSSSVT